MPQASCLPTCRFTRLLACWVAYWFTGCRARRRVAGIMQQRQRTLSPSPSPLLTRYRRSAPHRIASNKQSSQKSSQASESEQGLRRHIISLHTARRVAARRSLFTQHDTDHSHEGLDKFIERPSPALRRANTAKERIHHSEYVWGPGTLRTALFGNRSTLNIDVHHLPRVSLLSKPQVPWS